MVTLLSRFVALGLSVSIAACAGAPADIGSQPFPSRYKEIVREHLRSSLIDPYSARDFQIAAPKAGQIHIEGTLGYESGWTVCYRGNAKNRMGGYTGLKESVLLIKDDRVRGSITDSDHYDVRTNCKDARYEALALN